MNERASQRPPAAGLTDSGEDFPGTERFRIVRRLGAGGMGVVYEAYDRERDARVALKTLRTLKPDALLRFKNEFRALADITHPNLVSLGELFEEEGRWFFTMEMVDGEHFLDYVAHAGDPGDPSISVRSAVLDEPLSAASSSRDTEVSDPPAVLLPARSTDRPLRREEEAPTVHADEAEAVTQRPSHIAPAQPKPLSSGVNERRLRAAMAQLALGLSALHRAHKVHRDIKPSNILVTADGQVKILDFGLVADLLNAYPESHLVGTYSYMAPEQAGLKPIGPAADWYSVGVLLYKAVTGRLPVTGNAREVLVLKQAFEPAPPSAIADVPEDLDLLCVDLLRIDPAARPSEREILKRLRADPSAAAGSASITRFVGRRLELQALSKAFGVARKTRGVTFFVHGESGVGKSALVRRFVDGVTKDTPDGVVFSGRCYERENVPYKGIDGIIDAVSRHFTSLDQATISTLLPRQKGLVGQVFPVMRRVEAVAQAPKPAPGALDPQILRARLFFALREMFTRLAERAPLVLVIDDLQWADADSLALIAEIMRPPDAPKLLLLATMRTARDGHALVGRSVAEVAALFGGDVRQLSIESLPRDEAEALVAALMRDAGASETQGVEQIAAAAAGHPLFIDELVRRRLTIGADAGSLKLDEALWARIEKLDKGVRAVLEVVAVGGVPIAHETAARAAKIDFNEVVRRVGILRAQNLVRTAGVRRADTVEPYHDRVREAVLLHIDAETRARCHERLAIALEAADRADPEALATHWEGAGDADKAVVYALRAAAQAEEALAFDRAARLYERALALKPVTGAEATTLRTRLGDALANAGRGADAAPAYLEAARTAAPAEALTLRRRGAEELLRSGRIDEALGEFGTVLAAVGLELPETPQRALASLLYRRARVRLRGLDFEPKDEHEIPADVLQRIDICWAVAPVLGMVDIIRGNDYLARCLLMALEAGEPYRVARALAAEACSAATEGGRGRERTDKLLSAAVAAAKNLRDPYTAGWIELGHILSSYLEGRFRETYEACLRAEQIFSRTIGAWWEMATVDLYATLALFWLGDIAEQQRRVDRTLQKARERGDLSAVVNACTGFNLTPWLSRDDPGGARKAVDEAMGRWSRRGFLLAHYWELLGRVQIALYEGDGPGAYALLTERWPALSRSLLRRVQLIFVETAYMRSRAALALAAQRGTASFDKARLLREVESDAVEIAAEEMPWATPIALVLRAGCHVVRGELREAARRYDEAAAGFAAADMALLAAASRRRHGEIVGGGAGDAEVAEADAWMRQHQIESPARMAAMLAPGLPTPPREEPRPSHPSLTTAEEDADHVGS